MSYNQQVVKTQAQKLTSSNQDLFLVGGLMLPVNYVECVTGHKHQYDNASDGL